MYKKTAEDEQFESDIEWDGTRFTYINPNFLKKEREALKRMTYGEIADYLMFDSVWAIAFRKLGWTRKKDGGRTIYHKEYHDSCYVADLHEGGSVDRTEDFLIEKGGNEVTYTSITNEHIWFDDGRAKTPAPVKEILHGAEAVDAVTEGLRNAILGRR